VSSEPALAKIPPSQRGLGGCPTTPEDQGKKKAPFEIRWAEVRLSRILKKTPWADTRRLLLRDRCHYVTAVATPPLPLTKGEFEMFKLNSQD
jgi:hypothetical protein